MISMSETQRDNVEGALMDNVAHHYNDKDDFDSHVDPITYDSYVYDLHKVANFAVMLFHSTYGTSADDPVAKYYDYGMFVDDQLQSGRYQVAILDDTGDLVLYWKWQ